MTAKKQPPQKPPASLLSPKPTAAPKAPAAGKAPAAPKDAQGAGEKAPAAEPKAPAAEPTTVDPSLAAELAELKRKNEELLALLQAKAAPATPQEKKVFSPAAVLPKAGPSEPPAGLAVADQAAPDTAESEQKTPMVLDPQEADLAERFDLSDKDCLHMLVEIPLVQNQSMLV